MGHLAGKREVPAVFPHMGAGEDARHRWEGPGAGAPRVIDAMSLGGETVEYRGVHLVEHIRSERVDDNEEDILHRLNGRLWGDFWRGWCGAR